MRHHGLGEIIEDAEPLHHVEIRQRGARLRLAIPAGYAISRTALDERLVHAATAAGATFLSATSAQLLDCENSARLVALSSGTQQTTAAAELVLACDGLNGRLLDDQPGCGWNIAPDAWMGASAGVENSSFDAPAGVIAMHVAEGGYVGTVRLPGGGIHFAAAMDAGMCKLRGGPIEAMRSILFATGAGDCRELASAKPRGTALLTRQRQRYGAQRVLTLGDSCAYIEPFTGEGMTWAIESAALLAQKLPRHLHHWAEQTPECWQKLHHAAFAPHQALCRAMRFVLHRPWLWSPALRLAHMLPAAGQAIAASLERRGTILSRINL